MARPKKATVDYFPHVTEHRKTMFILETKWGNDGYASWFKILEKLGSSDGHFLDCREEISLTYLAAYCRVSEEILTKIIDTLAYLNAIDRNLWRQKVIFCQRFIDGVKDAYRKRLDNFPTREKVFAVLSLSVIEFPAEETQLEGVSDAGSTEREREREREIKEKLKTSSSSVDDVFLKFWLIYPRKVGKGDAEKAWKKISKPVETFALIEAALKWQKESIEWRKENGAFIPHPSTYLNQRRWEDESGSVSAPTRKLEVAL
jgi:hypothetical protein